MFSLAKYSLNLYNICCLGNKELTNEHQLLSTGLKRHFVCVLHFLGQCTWVFCLWVIWGIFHLCNGGQHSERKPGRTRGNQRPPKGCWNSHIARPERNPAWTGLELTTPGSVRCTSALTNSATSFFSWNLDAMSMGLSSLSVVSPRTFARAYRVIEFY